MQSVIVYVCARQMENKLSDREDVGVSGIYQVTLEVEDPDDIAGAALDAFHEEVPIGMLDDFDFSVFDPDGQPMTERDDYESYSYHGHSTVDRVGDLLMRCDEGLMSSLIKDLHQERYPNDPPQH